MPAWVTLPLWTALVGFSGYLVGGLLGVLTKHLFHHYMLAFQTFCGGLLIGILSFELIPEAWDREDPIGLLLGIVVGVTFMVALDRVLHERFQHLPIASEEQWHSFFFLLVGIGIHNFPTGFSVGVSAMTSEAMLSSFLFVLFVHHIPEGMALFIPLMVFRQAFLRYTASALFLAFILAAGVYAAENVEKWLSYEFLKFNTWMMGLAVGMVGFVAVHEILWKAFKEQTVVRFSFIILIAIIVTYFYFFFF